MVPESNDRLLASWLLLCAMMIFAMVILGGVTRLTGSGLSMVNWHPIHGVVPPLNAQEWLEEFANYQQSPEFQKINRHMDVGGFKQIFYFEYAHRMLGRLIGLVFLLPFLFFYFTGRVRAGLTPRLLIMFVLGGLQGLLGWYMVKSGLVDNPHVSQYRLTAHLITAILIYGFILWTAMGLLLSDNARADRTLGESWMPRAAIGLLGLIVVTILSGGFVAGLKAGLIFNSFPTMHGDWIPPGLFALDPLYLNFFENKVTVQFDHRWLAKITALLVLIYWWKGRQRAAGWTRHSFDLLALAVVVQVTLGISTLLMHVPVWLGATHQGGALVLFSAMLFNLFRVSRG
jgi:cytochrome c oxidase assembly protein subunit 15